MPIHLTIGRLMVVLSCVSTLAGCISLPHPFQGQLGATGRRLAMPPPSRLAVPTPTGALLPTRDASLLATDLAATLLAQEVPAMSQPAKKGDWQLRIRAALLNGAVVPRYSVLAPDGTVRGTVGGAPVQASAWARGDADAIRQAAEEAGPKLATLLTGIQAAEMQSNPNSLMNRPARIYFTGVTGAPGDGDVSLARQMAVSLPDAGDVIQNSPHDADFTLGGTVTLTHASATTDHVEIAWTVRTTQGTIAGKVSQLHDLPAHTLDIYWGDIAVVVAQQAAGGIREVITNNSGRAHKPIGHADRGRA